MIRLLHTSDSHWDERGRLQDVADVHAAMIEAARNYEIDLWLHAGDFFERRSTPAERTALADWLTAAAEIAPVWGCKGNHDAAGDLAIFNRLDTKHPVWIEERATVVPGSARILDLDGGRRLGLLGLAWIDKAHLVAGQAADVDQETTRQMAITSVRHLLTCLRAEATRVRGLGAVPILATHVMLGGSVVSTGQILIGQGIDLSPSDLSDLGCAYVACGHIHAAQEWYGGRVAYSGSPSRQTFGETEAKGFRLVTIDDDGTFVSSEFVELPARRMVLIEGTLDVDGSQEESAFDVLSMTRAWTPDEVKGALVRFRYHVRAEDLHRVNAEAIERVLLADGAAEVKLEAVVETTVRARVPEIVSAQSTADKLDHYLAAKAISVDDAQRDRLHHKVSEVEGACA